jgi:hypothetical protein
MDPEIYMIHSLHYVMIWYGVPLCNLFLDGPSIEMDDVSSCNLERGGGGGGEGGRRSYFCPLTSFCQLLPLYNTSKRVKIKNAICAIQRYIYAFSVINLDIKKYPILGSILFYSFAS